MTVTLSTNVIDIKIGLSREIKFASGSRFLRVWHLLQPESSSQKAISSKLLCENDLYYLPGRLRFCTRPGTSIEAYHACGAVRQRLASAENVERSDLAHEN